MTPRTGLRMLCSPLLRPLKSPTSRQHHRFQNSYRLALLRLSADSAFEMITTFAIDSARPAIRKRGAKITSDGDLLYKCRMNVVRMISVQMCQYECSVYLLMYYLLCKTEIKVWKRERAIVQKSVRQKFGMMTLWRACNLT